MSSHKLILKGTAEELERPHAKKVSTVPSDGAVYLRYTRGRHCVQFAIVGDQS
jgi:hypothetical protein